jgi:hypothetical protein
MEVKVRKTMKRHLKHTLMNCVLIRFPIMPCKPMLALMNPTHTKDSILVHVGLARESATLP